MTLSLRSLRTSLISRIGTAGAVLAVVGGLVVGIGGAAFAYLEETGHVSGSGGQGTVSPSSLPVNATSASISGSLYPGSSANLVVTITNPYKTTMTITGLVAGSGNMSVSGGSGCTVANSGVTLNTAASPSPTTVAANTSTQITFTNAVQMSATTNFSGCQNATFTVPAAVTTKAG